MRATLAFVLSFYLLPSISFAAPVSLYLVFSTERETIASLLDAGVVVSRVLENSTIVYGDDRAATQLEHTGCRFKVLEADVAGREHYVVVAPAQDLRKIRKPMALLFVDGQHAIVSLAEGNVRRLSALGFEVERLFRRPLRLPPHSPRVWSKTRLRSASDELIRSLVEQVSPDSLYDYVFTLESFGSRHAEHPGGRAAARWIESKLRSFGLQDVEIQQWNSRFWGNVVATLPGTTEPDEVYVIGGHYDSIVFNSEFAPGADDNASGTATMLECARILAAQQFSKTIRFIAFGAEELGLLGSDAYASHAAARGERLIAMINFDMLGYVNLRDQKDLDIIWNPHSAWLLDAAQDVGERFVPELPVISSKLLSGSSDHASFWRHGFDAIFFFEDARSPSPFIHTVDDIIDLSYNSNELHTLCTKTAVALLAALVDEAEVPVTLESFAARSDLRQIRLSWQLSHSVQQLLRGLSVHRARIFAGPYSPLTPALLPASARSFTDTEVVSGDYWYRLALIRSDGSTELTPPLQTHLDTGAGSTALETAFDSGDSSPIQIRYHVGPQATQLSLAVYDVRGQLVRSLITSNRQPGTYLQSWDRHNDSGKRIARGVYVIRLQTSTTQASRKLVLLNP